MNVFETVIEMVVHSHPRLQLTLEMERLMLGPQILLFWVNLFTWMC